VGLYQILGETSIVGLREERGAYSKGKARDGKG